MEQRNGAETEGMGVSERIASKNDLIGIDLCICGGRPAVHEYNGQYAILCSECELKAQADGFEKVVAEWNEMQKHEWDLLHDSL